MTKEQFEEKYGKQLKLSEKKWMLMSSRANKDNNLVIVSGYREIDFDYLYFIYKDEIWEMCLKGGIRMYEDELYTTRELFQLVLKNRKSIEYYPPGNKILYRTSGVNGQIIVALDYFATKIKSVLDPVITIQVPKEVWGPDEVVSDKHILEELKEFLKSQGYHKTIIDYVIKNTDVLFIKQGGEWDMGYLDALIENAKFNEISNIIPAEQDKKAFDLSNAEMKKSFYADVKRDYFKKGSDYWDDLKNLNSKEFNEEVSKIRTFDTGAIKNDRAKVSYSDLPPIALEQVAKAFNYGAEKYSKFNYMKGMEYLRYYDACFRHLQEWRKGNDMDESGNTHLSHAVASLLMLMENINLSTGTDNRPK